MFTESALAWYILKRKKTYINVHTCFQIFKFYCLKAANEKPIKTFFHFNLGMVISKIKVKNKGLIIPDNVLLVVWVYAYINMKNEYI